MPDVTYEVSELNGPANAWTLPLPPPRGPRRPIVVNFPALPPKDIFWVHMDHWKTLTPGAGFRAVATHSLCGCVSGCLVHVRGVHGVATIERITFYHQTMAGEQLYKGVAQDFIRGLRVGGEGASQVYGISFDTSDTNGNLFRDRFLQAGLPKIDYAFHYVNAASTHMAWGIALDGPVGELSQEWSAKAGGGLRLRGGFGE
jgi:hypothetical protein